MSYLLFTFLFVLYQDKARNPGWFCMCRSEISMSILLWIWMQDSTTVSLLPHLSFLDSIHFGLVYSFFAFPQIALQEYMSFLFILMDRVGDRTIGPLLLSAFKSRYKEVLTKAHTAAFPAASRHLTILTKEETHCEIHFFIFKHIFYSLDFTCMYSLHWYSCGYASISVWGSSILNGSL